jgi:hypothetical protein
MVPCGDEIRWHIPWCVWQVAPLLYMVGMRVPLARCGERAGHGDSGECYGRSTVVSDLDG